jgi:hypothetical protein
MDEKEITEVPLSNREVLKVLRARTNDSNGTKHHPRTLEMMEYLESIEKGPYQYPLEILRDLKISKNLDADLITLAVVSNISDLSILSSSDRKRVEQHFSKIKKTTQ